MKVKTQFKIINDGGSRIREADLKKIEYASEMGYTISKVIPFKEVVNLDQNTTLYTLEYEIFRIEDMKTLEKDILEIVGFDFTKSKEIREAFRKARGIEYIRQQNNS